MKVNISIFVGGVLRGSKQITTPCMIGRSREADLPIAHPAISRKHCELFEKAGNLYLRDNSSLNGTIYKGGYIENPTQLSNDDEFAVGELTFKVSLLAAASSEEQQEIMDAATVAISGDSVNNNDNNNLSDANNTNNANQLPANTGTVAESQPASLPEPQPTPQTPANETRPPKKASNKISPKDVRIVT